MNPIENNKLLAEFLGAKQYDAEDDFVYFDETDNIFSNDTISLKSLKFNTDWNWLMQVVEKIESLDIYYSKYIDYNSSMFTSGKIELSTKIEAVYNACVEFVKWYNTQSL